jgi:16S rRNA (adenine1518-N6/adenine1519-N6)-dimethyltransferase
MTQKDLAYILHRYHIHPKESRGQHFLFNDEVLNDIVTIAHRGAPSDKVVLEIGPGIGNLTVKLAAQYEKVIGVEIDTQFERLVDTIAAVHANIKILYDDILLLPFGTLRKAGITEDVSYSIVANIPYYITAKLIAHVLRYPIAPSQIVFLIQQEVAERIVAANGKYSKLALGVWFYGKPEIVRAVPRHVFIPKPDVQSSLLRISHIHAWQHAESEKEVWQLIAFGFSSKRKKLINNLCAGLRVPRADALRLLQEARIDVDVRAEDVLLPQWLGLARALHKPSTKK